MRPSDHFQMDKFRVADCQRPAFFWFGLSAGLFCWISAYAQPALENALLTDENVAARRRARTATFDEVKGLEVGSARFSLGASYSLQFNDNVNHSENNPEGDIIQIPSVHLGIDLPVTRSSSLSFDIGIGYRAYWHDESLSRWFINSGGDTGLSFDLQVKNVSITVFDRFSLDQSISTTPEVANQSELPRFSNTIGTQVTWVPGDFLVSSGYSYRITRSTDDSDDYLNRDTHLIFLRGGYVFAQGSANSGLEFSTSFNDYLDSIQSDSSIVSFGPYLDWQVSDAIRAGLRGGFLYTVNTLSFLPEDSFDANSYYAGLNIDHALTDYISYRLSISHGTRPSYQQGAAFTESTSVGYRISWALIERASLGGNINYTHGQQTIAAGVNPSETYDQWRLGLSLSYSLLPRLSSSVGYNYVSRDSNLNGRSYNQNLVTLSLGYSFN